ncbi:uncharacterized protein [Drosophila pseudoobscura]|uniref:Uncharacterized protein isoform X1 n=2 Tax=Drosophila pseudoobscura pseudoobscura TaxID=46245 RepID=A0A6I8VE51_DROPS|nr:uncharacterized protein LOC6898256 isoform X1 [Drosophila pseudoobscura]
MVHWFQAPWGTSGRAYKMDSKNNIYTKNERLTNEEVYVERLIRMYRANQCLWNPKSPGYHCAPLKQSAWNRITRILNNGLTTDQVKLQVLSLRNYYDTECQAIKRSQREGLTYVPCRSIFKDLQFLPDLEPDEAEKFNGRPSVYDDQLQFIIDDVMSVMSKNLVECRRSLHVDPDISSPNKSSKEFVEFDISSLSDSDFETPVTSLPLRATSGADRQYDGQDEKESSNSSSHQQSRDRYQVRGACPCPPDSDREGRFQRHARPTEKYSRNGPYEVAPTTNPRNSPAEHLQPLRPRMEASNSNSQCSRNSTEHQSSSARRNYCSRPSDKEECNVLLLKFNPENDMRPRTNNNVFCTYHPADNREIQEDNRDYNDIDASGQQLQSAETPLFEYYNSNENKALPADCSYSYDPSHQENTEQNEQDQNFYYPEGSDPYEYDDCYCTPAQEVAQLYHQGEESIANEEPTLRRPQPFAGYQRKYSNTEPDDAPTDAQTREQFSPNRVKRMPQPRQEDIPGSSSKDTTNSAPIVRSRGSRSSGADSYGAQQCAALAAQIMDDYCLGQCRRVQKTYPDDDDEFCEEPVARRPQRRYQPEDIIYVECPARRQAQPRNEVARRRESSPSKVSKARDEYKYAPQDDFVKSTEQDQGRRTSNQFAREYTQDRQQGQYEYDAEESFEDAEQRAKPIPQRRSYIRETAQAEDQSRGAQPPFQRFEKIPCKDDTCPLLSRTMEVAPRQVSRRSSDKGQTKPEKRTPPSERQQQIRGQTDYRQRRGMDGTDEPYMTNRCLPSSPNDSQPKSAPTLNQKYGSLENSIDPYEVDDCLCEDDPKYPQEIASTKRKSRQDDLGIPSSERNNRDDRHQEQRPKQYPQRKSYQREETAKNRPQGQRFQEIPCNNNLCPFVNPNFPENTSSKRNSQDDRPLKSNPTSKKMDSRQEESTDLYEGDDYLREDDSMVPEKTSDKKNIRLEESRGPVTASTKRNSRDDRQEEPSVSDVVSSEKGSRREELSVPDTTSSKRNSQENRQPKSNPISKKVDSRQEESTDLYEGDDYLREDDSMVPEKTSDKKNIRLEESRGPVTASTKRNSRDVRQEEPSVSEVVSSEKGSRREELSVPDTTSSKRNNQENRQPKSNPTSKKMDSSQEESTDLNEIDDCLCEDESMITEKTSEKRNIRLEESRGPVTAPPKRNSRDDRQEEPSVPEVASSEKGSRREEPSVPDTTSSKRNNQENQPPKSNPTSKKMDSSQEESTDLNEIDDYLREDDSMVPEKTSAKRNIRLEDSRDPVIASTKRNSRDDRQEEPRVLEVTSPKRSSRREEPSVPDTTSSKRNSQENRPPKSITTSKKMYDSQEKSTDLNESDDCRCEDESLFPKKTSAKRNIRLEKASVSENDSSKKSSNREEPIVPVIASSKRNWRDDHTDDLRAPRIQSSKRNNQDDWQQEQRPRRYPQRRSYQGEEPAKNLPQGQAFEEIPCNNNLCPFVKPNFPENTSSKRNSPDDRQPKSRPTSNKMDKSQEESSDLYEVDDCLCEDDHMGPQEITSTKRNSRQDVLGIPSSKRNNRDDRQQEQTKRQYPQRRSYQGEKPAKNLPQGQRFEEIPNQNFPENTSSKRNSPYDRQTKSRPTSTDRYEVDDCLCDDESMVPEKTPAKRNIRQEEPTRSSRWKEPSVPGTAPPKRNSQNDRKGKLAPTSQKMNVGNEKPMEPKEVDDCRCDENVEIAASKRNRNKNSRKDDEKDTKAQTDNTKGSRNNNEEPKKTTPKKNNTFKNYVNEQKCECDDADNSYRQPDNYSKKANGRNIPHSTKESTRTSIKKNVTAVPTRTGKEDEKDNSDSEYCDCQIGVESPNGKNIRSKSGNSRNTEDVEEVNEKGRNMRLDIKKKENGTESMDDLEDSTSLCECECFCEDEEEKPTDVKAEEETSAKKKVRTQQIAKATPRSQSTAGRSSATPKSRLRRSSNTEEMAKKPISSRSSKHNRQISGKRSMKNADYDGGTSSGCPFDLNRASYYICQLQDEDEENQYLIIVPEAKYRRMSVNRTCPGQELAKRKPCTPRQCSGFDTLSWASPKPAHQSYPRKTEGISVLGSYKVPPVAAETTMSIINQHIKMSIGRKPVVELIQKNHKYCTSKKNVNSPPKMQCKPKPKPMTAMAYNRTPILRPIHETSSILAENRTVLLSKNPGSSSNQEVIVLHPPVLGFRPSKNSLCLDDVQMQLIKVQHSEPHVSPRPM